MFNHHHYWRIQQSFPSSIITITIIYHHNYQFMHRNLFFFKIAVTVVKDEKIIVELHFSGNFQLQFFRNEFRSSFY